MSEALGASATLAFATLGRQLRVMLGWQLYCHPGATVQLSPQCRAVAPKLATQRGWGLRRIGLWKLFPAAL